MKNVKHMIGSLLKSRLGKQITSGILALAVATSPFYSTAMVIADEIESENPTEVTSIEDSTDTTTVDVISSEETTYTAPEESVETIVESEETFVPEESSETNESQAPPVEETSVSSETEVSETLETSETEVIETTEVSEEATLGTEQTEIAIPSEIEETVETTETSETEETVTEETEVFVSNIILAETAEQYYEIVSTLPEGYQRLVVNTYDDLSYLEVSTGVYYDGTYILVFDDVDTCATAVQVFKDNGYEYLTDNVFSICGTFNNTISYSAVNPSASVRVAVIDTGSNLANEQYSVIGDDPADNNGHGTAICDYILSETDDAYIISIKAIGDNGKGNMSDVYAAVQLAEDMNVDYILMAISIRDAGTNDAFISLIENTNATVVASAGNNNSDASLYLPAGISGVITIGAINDDGTKVSSSNYGEAVNYYLTADSTSAAAAIYLGKCIAGTDVYLANAYICGEGLDSAEQYETFEYLEGSNMFFVINGDIYERLYTGYSYDTDSEIYWALRDYNNASWAKSVCQAGVYQVLVPDMGWQRAVCICPKSPDPVDNGKIYSASETFGTGLAGVDIPTDDGRNLGNLTYGQLAYGCIKACEDFGWSGENYYLTHVIAAAIFGNSDDPNWSANKFQSEIYDVLTDKYGTATGSLVEHVNSVATTIYNYAETVDGDSGYFIYWATGVKVDSTYTQALLVTNPSVTPKQYTSSFYIDKVLMLQNGSLVKTDGATASTMGDAVTKLSGAQFSIYKDYQNGVPVDKRATLTDTANTGIYNQLSSEIKWDQNRDAEIFYIKETSAPTSWNLGGTWAAIPAGLITIDNSVYRIQVWKPSNADYPSAGDGVHDYYKIQKVLGDGNEADDPVIYEGNDTGGIRVTNFSTYTAGSNAPFGDTLNVQVTVKKTAVNASCVAGNPMYSLAGTTYGLYKANGTLVHTFMIDANGNTTAYTLDSIEDGMYVKEITAGPGFKLNTSTYQVKLSNVVNGLITINATDIPIFDPVYFDFIKTDNANWNMVNELKLSNTTFDFYYYTNVDTYTNFATYSASHTPAASGTITLNDFEVYRGSLRISPSSLNAAGITYFAEYASVAAGNQFPIGTYVIKEHGAPAGYAVSSGEFAWAIVQVGNNADMIVRFGSSDFSYTAIENGTVYMQEQPVFGYTSFKKVVDSNNDLEKLAPDLYNLDGTQYGVYSSADNLVMTITFDGSGNVKNVVYSSTLNLPAADKWTSGNTIKMQVGSYYIKELHSTNGYYLDPEKHTFTVTNGSTTAVTVQDTPIVAPFDMVLKTATSDSLSQEVLDLLSTQGATFIVTYYNTIITGGNINSAVPVLEATFITDATGTFTYDSGWYTPEFAASMYSTYADKLMDKDGNYMAPQGTYVIREITAPQDLEKSDVVLIIPVEFGKDIIKGSDSDPALMTAWSASLHNTVLGGVVYDAATGKFLYPNAINPTFNTNAANTNGGKQLIADVEQSITDTVTITKLASGFSYEVTAWLVSDNGTPADTTDDTYVSFAGATNVNGVPTITKSVTLNVTGVNNSTFDIVFNGIDATNYEGCTITVCENLYLIESNGTKHLYLAHDDINDTLQQVSVPGIRTTMLDAKIDTYDANADVWGQYTDSTGYTKHVAYGTNETLVDYVTYINLIPGEEYTVSGVLKNADTGEDLPYTGSTTFVPTTKNGVVEVYFEHVDTTKFVTAVVAFEYLDHDGIRIATHEDLSDSWQSLGPNPKIATEYLDVQSDSHGAVIGENVSLTDTVEITGLVVGQIYTLETTVYNGNTKVFIGTTTFEAGVDTDDIKWGTPYQIIDGITVVDGTLTIKTEIDTSKLIDITVDPVTGVVTDTKNSIVATQKLYFKGELISEHTDKNDQDQTVDVESPDVQTLFTDVQTVEHETVTGQEVELSDIVSYKGLHIGETYTMTCVIYDQTTCEALKYSDGTPVTMVKEFVPQTADGSVNVEITVNTADLLVNTFALEEQTLVAFEYLRTADGTLIAGHTDLEDQPQWVTPKKPELSTMLVDSASLTHDGAIGTNVVLTDTINYTNLNVGETYEVRGTLMLVDETGTASVLQVAAPVEFVPTSREGFVEVTFVVDSAALIEGDKSVYVVAFEELWQKNILTDEYEELASHEDIDDQDQTVNFDTDLKTTATDAETGTKAMVLKDTVSITDKVEFTNLNIGEEYTITGTLMNKATGEALLDENNQPYVQSLTFTATERDGYKEIIFKDVKVPYTVMSVVVFEDLYVGDMTTPVAIHHDLTDENQTVERPTASTIATVDGQKQVWLGNAEVVQLTITDTISYTNLVPGKTYRIETALYKADGTVVMNGENVATATALFIPETKDGTVDITIAFTTEGLVEGDKIVVFEQIWDVAEDIEKTEKIQTEDLLIAKHEDLNDSDQTIMIHFRPQTGLIDTPYAKVGIALIVSAAVGYFVYRTFKKKGWFISET